MSDETPKAPAKRGRRPKIGPKRDHNMLIKLTAVEKEKLWEAAISYGMTLSDFVRAACRDVSENGFSQPIKKL